MDQQKRQNSLQSANECAKIDLQATDTISVSRAELDKEHSLLIARLHQLRRLLGYPPLPTGKEARRAHAE